MKKKFTIQMFQFQNGFTCSNLNISNFKIPLLNKNYYNVIIDFGNQESVPRRIEIAVKNSYYK